MKTLHNASNHQNVDNNAETTFNTDKELPKDGVQHTQYTFREEVQ
jgi:hypothetical protein